MAKQLEADARDPGNHRGGRATPRRPTPRLLQPSVGIDYFLANPPFGVDWKRQEKDIKRESDRLGFKGRFGAGVPRVSDGALLFLQHMGSKRQDPNALGSRLATVFNVSPLFGRAESGETNIRKWIIENDWLEAIVALPEQMFYNTGIAT